jgi:hypothetical protein
MLHVARETIFRGRAGSCDFGSKQEFRRSSRVRQWRRIGTTLFTRIVPPVVQVEIKGLGSVRNLVCGAGLAITL